MMLQRKTTTNGSNGSVKPALLNLGCGKHFHSDWTNMDCVQADPSIMVHDLRQRLPFPDETFDAVYHSHVLEHLPREKAFPFIRECFRVLKGPGGLLRVVVPDLERIAILYLEKLRGAVTGDPRSRLEYEWIVVELIDQLVRHHPDGGEMFKYLCRDPVPALDFVIQRMGHEVTSKLGTIRDYVKGGLTPEYIDRARAGADAGDVGRFRTSGEAHLWMYDRYSLAQLLEQGPFEEIRVVSAHESNIPHFCHYHLDVLEDKSVRKPDSLFMEARKGAANRAA
jgi:SAM-dependent methyltransferase